MAVKTRERQLQVTLFLLNFFDELRRRVAVSNRFPAEYSWDGPGLSALRVVGCAPIRRKLSAPVVGSIAVLAGPVVASRSRVIAPMKDHARIS